MQFEFLPKNGDWRNFVTLTTLKPLLIFELILFSSTWNKNSWKFVYFTKIYELKQPSTLVVALELNTLYTFLSVVAHYLEWTKWYSYVCLQNHCQKTPFLWKSHNLWPKIWFFIGYFLFTKQKIKVIHLK